jgi:dsDNA-specific endonuclease/ATPase MutS2
METILALFKYLAAGLSPTEFLVVIGIIAVTTVFLVRFVLENKVKIAGWLTGQKETDATGRAFIALNKRIDTLATTSDMEKLMNALRVAYANHENNVEELLNKFEELSNLRTQVALTCDRILDEVAEVKHLLQSHNDGSQAQYMSLLGLLNKNQEAIARNLNQLEKIDEYMKATVPEFRAYHRDLGTELNNLSRDIALVERSLQMQINTANAVKLR